MHMRVPCCEHGSGACLIEFNELIEPACAVFSVQCVHDGGQSTMIMHVGTSSIGIRTHMGIPGIFMLLMPPWPAQRMQC
jgi:hypothetical protein